MYEGRLPEKIITDERVPQVYEQTGLGEPIEQVFQGLPTIPISLEWVPFLIKVPIQQS